MSALRRQRPALPVALEARVSSAAPAALTVTIDDFDGEVLARHSWEVASWPRRPDAVPVRGDRCLVVMSEIGRPWVVAGEWSGAPVQWRELPLRTGWLEQNRGASPAGYAKSPDGWVTLRGLVRKWGGAAAAEDLLLDGELLPRGFRPATSRAFPSSVQPNLTGRLQVNPDGELSVAAAPTGIATGAFWTLDGIGYWAERTQDD